MENRYAVKLTFVDDTVVEFKSQYSFDVKGDVVYWAVRDNNEAVEYFVVPSRQIKRITELLRK